MRLGWVLVLACACGSPRPAARESRAVAPPPPPPPVKRVSALIPSAGPLGDPKIAPPSGAIQTLAISPDGSAALTADETGATRLWPALDGSQEPRVVKVDRAQQLALVRSADGYLAAAVDEARGLTLLALDAEGRTRAHRSIVGDPSVIQIRAVSVGILVWTSDEKLALYDLDGNARGALGTQPGERLTALATNGAQAIAEVELAGDKPTHHLRGVTLEPALAWTDFIDAGIEPTGAIAVSPSGEHVALIAGKQIAFVNARHGVKIAALSSNATALAFVGEDHVATATDQVEWFEVGGLAPTFVAGPSSQVTADRQAAFAAAGDRVAMLVNGGIALATPQRVGYLGYAIITPSLAVAAGSATLMLAQADRAALVDDHLQTRGAIELGTPDGVAWLGSDAWLVSSPTPGLRVISAGEAHLVPGAGSGTATLRYEPSTHIAVAAFANATVAYRWDERTRAMTPLTSDRAHTAYRQLELFPTDPHRANGVQLVRVTVRDGTLVEWFSDPQQTTRTASYRCNAVLAVDRAGRAYVVTSEATPRVAIVANGTEVGALPLAEAAWLAPEPDGDRVAALTTSAIELYGNGARVWSRDRGSIRSLVWTGAGLVAVMNSSIARLDLATGEPALQRCGVVFGLATKPFVTPPPSDCD